METVNRKIILVALFMAFITTFLIYFYIKDASTKTQIVKEDKVRVFVASKDLAVKQKITEGDLRAEDIPAKLTNKKAIKDKKDIIGKMTRDAILEGEQILSDRLVSDDKTDLVYNVPEGKRALSININEQIAVSNLIRPGDYVDIIANFEKEEMEDKNDIIIYPRMTKTALENILVLALGQEQIIEKDDKTSQSAKTVTFALTPEEAERLVYVSEFATIRLALRSVGDNNTKKTQGVTRIDVTSERNSKVVPYSRRETGNQIQDTAKAK
ncbi:Flp pilus assembly protein CpaB [Pseudobacteroides cellulosolvens]|uniref:Flp pilus assembly protein CpaB n=1 Tax=Pseudobacteroides cellulosolvens ATCC 35603 = DSM 2933 TaxID=398512 RepID=A0A0L6JHA4_9FIRM|nr:Flp pilus assembly protein CpaB [Pseudobacteroides cellulosolvens]KNY25095.1 Flp pilus assembly protein CpaB [Pseudobacteroides cellulosolvens ATCC 35603 = DSM 2933]